MKIFTREYRINHAASLLFILIVGVFTYSIYRAQNEPFSPQSLANLRFASNASFSSALSEHPKYWPPLYPGILWVVSQLGLNVRIINLLLFYILLAMIARFSINHIPGAHWTRIIAVIALLNANYVNLYQLVSEPLFVLIAFLVLLVILRYASSPSFKVVCLLALFVSVACLTRFFALFWLMPVCLASIWFRDHPLPSRQRFLHAFAFCGIISCLVFPWLAALRMTTGSFSGMDRIASRGTYSANFHAQAIPYQLYVHFKFTLKTVFIDLFSVYRYASHGVITFSSLTRSELIVALLLILLIAASLTVAFPVFYSLLRKANPRRILNTITSPAGLPFLFAASYVLCMILVWTFTNNDFIYTRFMYPLYPFLIISVFLLYSRFKQACSGPVRRIVYSLPLFLLSGINLVKDYLSLVN